MSNKPEQGKVYRIMGGPGESAISNGNSWAESEVQQTTEVLQTLGDEDESCSQCGHQPESHFGKEGYGCDECPSHECGPSLEGVDGIVRPE